MKNSLNTIYLLLSLLVSLLMVFLDPIAAASSEAVAGVLIYLILFGAAITFINMAIIALVLIFGSLLS